MAFLETKVCVLIVCALIVGQYGQIEAASENTVGDSGNITWKDLPSGNPYKSPDSYDEGESPLPTIWSMVAGWLDVVSPGEIPYELITDAIGGELEMSDISIMDYSDLFLGFGVCFVLGLLFLLIFPIVACCFCGCRTCCGKCGGKMYQKQTGNMECKMITFTVILAVITLVLSGGFACGFFVNARQSSEIENLGTNTQNSLDDMLTFVNNTVDEILFVALNQSSWIFEIIEYDLSNVGETVGLPVREALRPYVGSALDAILGMVATIEATRDGLDDLNSLVSDLDANYTYFEESIADLKQDIEDLYANCAGAGGCSAAGQDPQNTADTTNIVTSRNFTDLPLSGTGPGYYPRTVVTAKSNGLTSVINNDLEASAEAGRQDFEEIPELVQNETDSAVGDLVDSFDDFNGEIEDGLDPMIENLDSMSSVGSSLGDTISEYSETAIDYDQYRSLFVLFLYFIALVVFILNILGIIFGLIGYDRYATPTKRSMLSNIGGLLLMVSTGLCFIFAVLLMAFTSFPFLIAGPITKIVCGPIVSGELFENTIDLPDTIPGSSGYYLGSTLFDNGNVSVTFTGILDNCGDNKAAYTAFQLMHIVNISEMLDMDSYISDGQFEDMKVNISDQVEIMSSETADNLADARDVNAASIPWSDFENELTSDLIDIGEDLNDFADDLQSYIDANSGSSSVFPGSYESQFTTMVSTIRSFQTSTVEPMVSDRDYVENVLNSVQSNSSKINLAVNNTIAAGDAADTYISNNLDSVVASEVENFQSTLIGYINQFVDYITDMIYNEVGKCRPVKNLLNNLINTVCRGVLDPINGWWFCNGWCVFCFILNIIFSVRLAKFFRRMHDEDESDALQVQQRRTAASEMQKPVIIIRNNQVSPSPDDFAQDELQEELNRVPNMLFDDPDGFKKKKGNDLPGVASTSNEYDPDGLVDRRSQVEETMTVDEIPGVVTTEADGGGGVQEQASDVKPDVENTETAEANVDGGDGGQEQVGDVKPDVENTETTEAKIPEGETTVATGDETPGPAVYNPPTLAEEGQVMENVNNNNGEGESNV